MGGSTGVNVAGAIRLAKEMGPGHTIVTLLCDYGTRYQSKLFNPAFLKSKNLPVPRVAGRRAAAAAARCSSIPTTVSARDTVSLQMPRRSAILALRGRRIALVDRFGRRASGY